jgi:hypothetical protein
VMKLLAKNAEDRYQTAAGLTIDLRKCLAEWESRRRIDAFSLGASDVSPRLLIPKKSMAAVLKQTRSSRLLIVW